MTVSSLPDQTGVLRSVLGTEDPEAVRDLVARDVRGETSEEERAFLRSPDGLDLWHDALVALNKEIQDQFAKRRADAQAKQQDCLKLGPEGKAEWFEYKAAWAAWRAVANRFKSGVEGSLVEWRRLSRAHKRDRGAERSRLERGLYRGALHDVREFLLNDAAISPAYFGRRDELLTLLKGVLFDQAKILEERAVKGDTSRESKSDPVGEARW